MEVKRICQIFLLANSVSNKSKPHWVRVKFGQHFYFNSHTDLGQAIWLGDQTFLNEPVTVELQSYPQF